MRRPVLSFFALVACLLCAPSPAHAADVVLSHAGYVIGGDDAPLDGTFTMQFALWRDPSSAAEAQRAWPATPASCAVSVKAGYFSVLLGGGALPGGCGAQLSDAIFTASALYLQVSIGGVPLEPRVRLDLLPAARRALDAERLDGRTRAELVAELDATYASDTALDAHASASGGVHGVAGPLAGTSAAQVLTNKTIDALTNTISNLGNLEIAASAAIARSKLAAGTPNALVVNGASGAMEALAAGAAGQVLTADPASPYGLKWAAAQAGGDGSMPKGSTAPVTCAAATAGQLYFDTDDKQIYGCNGANYVPVGTSGNATGGTPATAQPSCEAIRAFNPTLPSDRYFIDPNGGDTSDAYEVFCNMDLDDGGWALAMNLDSSDATVRAYSDAGFWTGSGAVGTLANARTADFKSAQVFAQVSRKLLVVVHQEGNVLGWRAWDLASGRSLQSYLSDTAARTATLLTGTSTNASVTGLDSREAVVRPAGRLRTNVIWGDATSFDLARIRSDTFLATDNALWGLGMQMDAQNNNTLPYYPGCDVGSTEAWTSYFCIGSDRTCPYNCGTGSGGTQGLEYDYAIYVKDPVLPGASSLAGASPATAALDCAAVQAARPTAASGVYWVNPAGTAVQAFCELSTAIDGGGWTLALNLDSSDGNVRHYTDAWWTNAAGFGTAADGLVRDYKSAEFFARRHRKVLVAVHREGGERLGWRSWNLNNNRALADYFRHNPSRADNLMTAGALAGEVSALDAREVVVRPTGELRANAVWGDSTSYDLARLRSTAHGSTDNAYWGLGFQMDAQNNSQNPLYPGCDVGTSDAWSAYMCAGADKLCTSQCGSASGSSRDLELDYAIYVKDAFTEPAVDTSALGGSATNPGASCEAIKLARPAAPSGRYWLSNGGTYEAFCDMEIAGGGWVLALNLDTSDGRVRNYTDGFWTGTAAAGALSAALTEDYKSAEAWSRSYTRILVRVHKEDLETVGFKAWNLASTTSLQALFASAQSRTPAAVTAGVLASNTGALDSRESVILPAGNLRANMIWGNATSYDLARLRNDALAGTDNAFWGLGIQMDAQNNSQNPYYPGCDAGSNDAWTLHLCVGTDRTCTFDCGDGGSSSRFLSYDYAVYLK